MSGEEAHQVLLTGIDASGIPGHGHCLARATFFRYRRSCSFFAQWTHKIHLGIQGTCLNKEGEVPLGPGGQP